MPTMYTPTQIEQRIAALKGFEADENFDYEAVPGWDNAIIHVEITMRTEQNPDGDEEFGYNVLAACVAYLRAPHNKPDDHTFTSGALRRVADGFKGVWDNAAAFGEHHVREYHDGDTIDALEEFIDFAAYARSLDGDYTLIEGDERTFVFEADIKLDDE